jgi:hypothetical protein
MRRRKSRGKVSINRKSHKVGSGGMQKTAGFDCLVVARENFEGVGFFGMFTQF